VKGALSLQLLLPKLPHHGEMLQHLTQLEIFPTPLGKIENSHNLPVRKKIKNLIQEEEDNLIENDIQRFSLDDMELVDIEKIFPAME